MSHPAVEKSIHHVTSTHPATAAAAHSDDEVTKYANAAADQLENPSEQDKFADNVKQVGVWANQIDASFDKVTKKFKQMNDAYGKDFPGFGAYNTEWISYNARWVKLLSDSRDVASRTIATLKRFNKVFLDMVEQVRTEQDRKDCILELQSFIDEKHDDQTLMAQGFLNLKRDIEDFVTRLDAFIVATGADLQKRALELKNEIDGLQAEIEQWDKKIDDATKALIAMGSMLNLIGVIVAGSVLASYKKSRADVAKTLSEKQDELVDVNRKQKALAELKSDFDGVKPDITLICDKLVLFGEIWSSVRSQTVQFQTMLQGGKDAQTNLRFKAELRLARSACEPLQEGLQRYATELENRKKK